MACTEEDKKSGKCKEKHFASHTAKKHKPNLRVGEKIAANQHLPYENLLEEFLRQQLAPDPNDGNNYYLGKVVSTFFEDDNSYDVYDIFNDSAANIDRFLSGNKVDEVKVNKVVVHIPELFSTRDVPRANDLLSYYTKFKINFSKDEKIKADDIVKIIFKNSKDFTDPEIVSIYRSNETGKIEIIQKKLKETFDKSTECKVLQLEGADAPVANRSSIFSDEPVAGYSQLKKAIDEIFNPEIGLENFKRQQNLTTEYRSDLENYLQYDIYCDPKVTGKYNFKNYQKEPFVSSDTTTSRLDSDIVIRIYLKTKYSENGDVPPGSLKKTDLDDFGKFINEKLLKYKNFIVSLDPSKESGKDVDYKLAIKSYKDINVDISAVALEKLDKNKPILDQYLEASDKLSGNFSTTSSTGPNISSQQKSSTTATANSTNKNCDNVSPANQDLYIPTSDLNKWKRLNADTVFVDYFLSNNPNLQPPIKYNTDNPTVDSILLPQNLYISGDLLSANKNNVFYSFEDLFEKNPKFYSIPQKVKQQIKLGFKSDKIRINSNFGTGSYKVNFITKDALHSRIVRLSDFLISLKELISLNEGVPPDRILILPINVIRVGGADSDSRHFFGQAVDFVVYINFSDDPKTPAIFQIPPEVVYLYCRKRLILTNQKQNSGQGIFIEEGYNHLEFLAFLADEETPAEVKKDLPKDIINNGWIWIKDSKTDPKVLDQPSDKLEEQFVRIIQGKYGNAINGTTINKIMNLV